MAVAVRRKTRLEEANMVKVCVFFLCIVCDGAMVRGGDEKILRRCFFEVGHRVRITLGDTLSEQRRECSATGLVIGAAAFV
jgi:hypothetical protein